MKAIVVADENWAIGKDGGLLVHLPGDLKYFKEKTMGKTIVMGRATLESLPGGKPLPGRRTIVLSRSGELAERLSGRAQVISSKEKLFEELEKTGDTDEVYIAGGQDVYAQFLPCCREVLVTKLEKQFEGADKFFPDLDQQEEWEMAEESRPRQENGVTYRFTVYKRK